jgi:hypothetical protein
MKQRLLTALTVAWAGMLVLNGTMFADSGKEKIHPYLQQVLNSKKNQEKIPVYIMLNERLSLEYLQSRTAGLSKKERRREVVRILKEHAARTQGGVLSYLENAGAQGLIERIENIWSINVIAFKARPAAVYALAQGYSEIEMIHYDRPIPREEAQDDLGISIQNEINGTTLAPTFSPQQGLILINAPAVWAAGDSGQGAVLANVDGGADWKHPDLANNLWNNLGEDANGNGKTVIQSGSTWIFDPGDVNGVDDDGNGRVDDFIGWNFTNNSNDPSTSSNSHGTSTAGILVGDGTNGTQTGVAPRAKLMDLNISSAGESGWWAAYQYAFENGADVTTSSYSRKWYHSPQPNYPMFRQVADMELAAGTLHTNSTSNDGNSVGIPFNISAAGCIPGPWVHPDQTLVGGISSVIGSANVDGCIFRPGGFQFTLGTLCLGRLPGQPSFLSLPHAAAISGLSLRNRARFHGLAQAGCCGAGTEHHFIISRGRLFQLRRNLRRHAPPGRCGGIDVRSQPGSGTGRPQPDYADHRGGKRKSRQR